MTPVVRRQGKVMRLALPIMLGMLSQSVLNLIDAALVSHLGQEALAGVGLGGYAMFMMTALVFGLSSSVQSQTAQAVGANQSCLTRPLGSGLVIGVAVGLPISCIAWWQAPELIRWIAPSQAVTHIAVDYFRLRIVALTAIALTLCLRGYWNGRQQTHLYLRIIVVVHTTNVALSAALIYGVAGLPGLGVNGAAIGTTLSLLLGLGIWGVITWRQRQPNALSIPSWQSILSTLTLAFPHSLQQLWFAAGYVVLFWLLGKLGTPSVAVGHVLVNISLLLILPGVGVGVAAMSLVGEALGRDDRQAAHRWGIDALSVAGMLLTVLALPMLVIPDTILGIFFTNEALVQLGRLPLQITGLMIVFDAAALVLAQALMGAGAQRTVMLLTLGMQWLLFLPLAWWVGIWLGYGLVGVWLTQLFYRLLNSTGFLWVWQRRRWLVHDTHSQFK
ncbi:MULTISPECIES: MATE family efflux transporter [Halomonadaceae]|uniref:MATE family efflux transporter n=1 Tax=Halomonadaceae TaxID=28256 RepID=UPI001C62E1D4|nr:MULTISPECIES: MATE family efflux transporter [Halomonas]MCG7591760.1 MATE family efflux transporter [Halomonas sp. McD50-5]MCG7614907.1 MATE family efflux transporter [Halomonas sp. McD50-4]